MTESELRRHYYEFVCLVGAYLNFKKHPREYEETTLAELDRAHDEALMMLVNAPKFWEVK